MTSGSRRSSPTRTIRTRISSASVKNCLFSQNNNRDWQPLQTLNLFKYTFCPRHFSSFATIVSPLWKLKKSGCSFLFWREAIISVFTRVLPSPSRTFCAKIRKSSIPGRFTNSFARTAAYTRLEVPLGPTMNFRSGLMIRLDGSSTNQSRESCFSIAPSRPRSHRSMS